MSTYPPAEAHSAASVAFIPASGIALRAHAICQSHPLESSCGVNDCVVTPV